MSVNRYDPEDWGGLHMVPKPDGDWVCYEAWEHVNRQLAALKEENERLKARVAELKRLLAVAMEVRAMIKHTAGPWRYTEVLGACTVSGGKREILAHRHSPDYENRANARLIAEAPKLLSLLKEARSTLEMWKDVAPALSLCADIDKALTKVAGEKDE